MTKKEKLWLSRICRIGCIVCRKLGYETDGQEVSVHHLRDCVGLSQRANDLDAIPLCPLHHQNGGYGVAIHAGQKAWEGKFGTERELLNEVQSIVADKLAKGELT
jgi:hypothetical protein